MTRGVGGHSPANVSHHLKGIDFPVGKEGLIRHAKKGGADKAVIDTLSKMPEREYGNMADVMKGYGEVK